MMERIELDHWFVDDNKLLISFMRYYVDIRIYQNDTNVFYQLRVLNQNKESLIFNFDSLEDAIVFTEQTIRKSRTLKEIIKSYQEQWKQEKFKSLKKVKK